MISSVCCLIKFKGLFREEKTAEIILELYAENTRTKRLKQSKNMHLTVCRVSQATDI